MKKNIWKYLFIGLVVFLAGSKIINTGVNVIVSSERAAVKAKHIREGQARTEDLHRQQRSDGSLPLPKLVLVRFKRFLN